MLYMSDVTILRRSQMSSSGEDEQKWTVLHGNQLNGAPAHTGYLQGHIISNVTYQRSWRAEGGEIVCTYEPRDGQFDHAT